MKKAILITILGLSLSVQVRSQALIAAVFGKKIDNPALIIGVQVGGNVSFQSNTVYDSPRKSFAFGAFTDYRFNPKWHLNTFISFKSNRGVMGLDTSYTISRPLDPSLQNARLDRKLSYVDINPEIQFDVTEGLSLGCGPMISVMTKAVDYYHDEGAKEDQNEYNIYADLVHWDAGISADLQYKLRKGPNFNLKYIQGFNNPYKSGVNPAAVNSFLYLGIGIPISAHGK